MEMVATVAGLLFIIVATVIILVSTQGKRTRGKEPKIKSVVVKPTKDDTEPEKSDNKRRRVMEGPTLHDLLVSESSREVMEGPTLHDLLGSESSGEEQCKRPVLVTRCTEMHHNTVVFSVRLGAYMGYLKTVARTLPEEAIGFVESMTTLEQRTSGVMLSLRGDAKHLRNNGDLTRKERRHMEEEARRRVHDVFMPLLGSIKQERERVEREGRTTKEDRGWVSQLLRTAVTSVIGLENTTTEDLV